MKGLHPPHLLELSVLKREAFLKRFRLCSVLRLRSKAWKDAKGIPTKGIGRNSLKLEKRAKSGVFFWLFSGAVRTLAGCSQGIFPHPLCGYPLWTLPKKRRSKTRALGRRAKTRGRAILGLE